MPAVVNKIAVAAAFSRAASTYEHFAAFQRISGDHLLAQLGDVRPHVVLDAGCGTGWFSRHWQAHGAEVFGLDLSDAMLRQARAGHTARHYLAGDIESLPLQSGCVDLAWSNLAVQWCSNLRRGLAELYRVTRPGGHIAFTTLADGSLQELNQAWAAVDARRHGNRFLPETTIQDACAGWRYQLKRHHICQQWPDVLSAMRSLKGIGATHLHEGRASGVLTRRGLETLSAAWPRRDGQFLLSYQLITGVIERD